MTQNPTPQAAHTARTASSLNCPPGYAINETAHAVIIDGPLRYPGGKNGLHVAHCTCGNYSSSPNTETGARKAHADHAASKSTGLGGSETS